MTRGYAIGGIDSVHPIASLGDVPPRGKGSRDTRSVGLTANYTSQAPGTIKPMVTADTKRIPKKPGQKDKSDKHSDLYTDENPKGTIHGLGFTDGEKARQSVN